MVDFGVTRKPTSLGIRLANRAAAPLPQGAVAPLSTSKLVYFRAAFPKTSFILPNGIKYMFGDVIPYWCITEDPLLIEYIRTNFVNTDNPGVHIEELDEYTHAAATLIQPEILPLPGQDKVDI